MSHTPEHMDGLRYSAELVEQVNEARDWRLTLVRLIVAAGIVGATLAVVVW